MYCEIMNIPIAIIWRCLAFSLLCSFGAETCSCNSCFSSSPECMDGLVLMSVEALWCEAEVTSPMDSGPPCIVMVPEWTDHNGCDSSSEGCEDEQGIRRWKGGLDIRPLERQEEIRDR